MKPVRHLPLTGLWLACFAALTAATPVESRSENENDEAVRKAITKASLDYVEGWYMAAPERLGRALHPDLNKVQVVKLKNGMEILSHQSADRLIRGRTGAKGESEPPDIEVSILSISRKTASVEIVSPDFVDFAHLAECNGEWVVVNVLWHVIEKRD